MAVNSTEPRFEAPVPGMSMTHELGARPWQQPPQQSSVEEALQYYLPRMQEDAFTDNLLNVIEMGMPLTTLANTIQLAGVMEGRHTAEPMEEPDMIEQTNQEPSGLMARRV